MRPRTGCFFILATYSGLALPTWQNRATHDRYTGLPFGCGLNNATALRMFRPHFFIRIKKRPILGPF